MKNFKCNDCQNMFSTEQVIFYNENKYRCMSCAYLHKHEELATLRSLLSDALKALGPLKDVANGGNERGVVAYRFGNLQSVSKLYDRIKEVVNSQ